MAERTYQRIHCKIDDFPEEAREAIDRMLADPTATYTEIAETMTARGFAISKSAIHRYAARMGADQQRLIPLEICPAGKAQQRLRMWKPPKWPTRCYWTH